MSNSANLFPYYESSGCAGTEFGQITEGTCFTAQGDTGAMILSCQENGSVTFQLFLDASCTMQVTEISLSQGICQGGTTDSFKNTCPVVATASASEIIASASGIIASASGIIASASEIVTSVPGAVTSAPRAIASASGVPAHSQGGRLEIQLMPMFLIMFAALFAFKITRNILH